MSTEELINQLRKLSNEERRKVVLASTEILIYFSLVAFDTNFLFCVPQQLKQPSTTIKDTMAYIKRRGGPVGYLVDSEGTRVDPESKLFDHLDDDGSGYFRLYPNK